MNEKTTRVNENHRMNFNTLPDQTFVPGGSVDEHRKIEAGNIILSGDEISQQNENL